MHSMLTYTPAPMHRGGGSLCVSRDTKLCEMTLLPKRASRISDALHVTRTTMEMEPVVRGGKPRDGAAFSANRINHCKRSHPLTAITACATVSRLASG